MSTCQQLMRNSVMEEPGECCDNVRKHFDALPYEIFLDRSRAFPQHCSGAFMVLQTLSLSTTTAAPAFLL